MAMMFLFFIQSTRAGIYYTIYCFILWLLIRYPKYKGRNNITLVQSKDHYSQLIKKPLSEIDKSSKETKAKATNKDFSKVTSTFVIFTDPLCDNCYFTQSIWIKYANKYATEKM